MGNLESTLSHAKCQTTAAYSVSFFIIIYIVKQNMNILQSTCFIQVHIHLNIKH